MEIELGWIVQDTITGYKGTAVSRTVYLNGCIRIGIQSNVTKDGKLRECEWVDEQQLKVLKKPGAIKTYKVGGDRGKNPPSFR